MVSLPFDVISAPIDTHDKNVRATCYVTCPGPTGSWQANDTPRFMGCTVITSLLLVRLQLRTRSVDIQGEVNYRSPLQVHA